MRSSRPRGPTRRQTLALLGVTAATAACDRGRARGTRGDEADASARATADWRTLDFPSGTPGAPDGQRALLFTPEGQRELPLLVALHGRGESGRGLAAGARGWRDDYRMEHIHRRLLQPPITSADLGGLADAERLRTINASLGASAYRGMCVACPYTPDLRDRSVAGAADFARFLIEALLPRARADGGCRADRAATGIDGVSMGGRLALLVGLSHPETFGAIGALQPALRPDEASMFVELAARAAARAPIRLRLVSSAEDPFLPAVRALGDRLRAGGVEHQVVITPGPHDYEWNRGPGSVEMLLWHERVMRGLPAP
jgi:poly(3-hydroxybutyrate) depolymerase